MRKEKPNMNYQDNHLHSDMKMTNTILFVSEKASNNTQYIDNNHVDDSDKSVNTQENRPEIGKTIKRQQQQCRPSLHVLFLKTHKTGSSTITNILNRFAVTRNLTMLLPRQKESYNFQWPNKFRLSAAAATFARPNILANHARYSRDTMGRVFPRPSSRYVTILRNPVPQFESSFEYFSFAYMLKINSKRNALQYFLDHPPTHAEIASIARKYPSLNLIRNPLFYDLGLDYRDYDNKTVVENAINTINHDFDLVLLMEHFDESLTLLRRRLCWDIDDVIYFKLNERLSKNKPTKPMSNDTVSKIQQWNSADMGLYAFFKRKFWQEIKKEGPGFYDDVEALRKRRRYYAGICIEDEAIEQAYSQVYVKGYKMRTNLAADMKERCELMLKNEIKFLNYFKKQYSEYWNHQSEASHIENFQDVLPLATATNEIPDEIGAV